MVKDASGPAFRKGTHVALKRKWGKTFPSHAKKTGYITCNPRHPDVVTILWDDDASTQRWGTAFLRVLDRKFEGKWI